MHNLFSVTRDTFLKRLTDETYRYFFQLQLLCLVLGSVSLFMGIMNVLTHKTVLMIATMVFSVVCFGNFFILRKVKRSNLVSYAIFDVSVICLFVYFLLTGGTAGFSPHWILLLPTSGMMLLGRRHGCILSALMLMMTVFLLWSPVGRDLLLYAYTPEFCMRFPVVYIAFFLIGYSFEWMRSSVHRMMMQTQKELAHMAEKDVLTGLKNRFWFNKRFSSDYDNQIVHQDCLALLMDIDNFKHINDTYGHPAGDAVLCGVARTICAHVNDSHMVCRWGGEEFFAFIKDCSAADAARMCERIRQCVEQTRYAYNGQTNMSVTISIGAVHVKSGDILDVEKLLCQADEQLYKAKQNGKNTVSLNQKDRMGVG